MFERDHVTIIADIGICWNSPDVPHRGDFHMALTLIEQAATVADFVKFQLYDPMKIFPPTMQDIGIQVDINKKLREEAQGYQLTKADWTFLSNHIRQCGAQPMVSVFDEERLQWAEDTGVVAHKLASRVVATDPDLCASVLALNKPTLISLGQWEAATIPYPLPNAHYLRCVSSYPTMPEQIAELDMSFDNTYVGFSDHTKELYAAEMAISRGASVIEKHFTWNKDAPGSDHAGAMDLKALEGLRTFATHAVEMGSLDG